MDGEGREMDGGKICFDEFWSLGELHFFCVRNPLVYWGLKTFFLVFQDKVDSKQQYATVGIIHGGHSLKTHNKKGKNK